MTTSQNLAFDSQVRCDRDAWSQRIELSLQNVVANLDSAEGRSGAPARAGLVLVEQALRVAAAALQDMRFSVH
jgi:hypothetical protein